MPVDKRLKFAEGERVLCYHGPLLYEAKCIKGQAKDTKIGKYLIHYNGWNKNWDEWVAESRVMKYSEENLKKQKELKQQYTTSKRAKKRAAEIAKAEAEKKESSGESQPKRRKRTGNTSEAEPSYLARLDVRIIIPHEVRRFLLDDSDFVNRQKQLVPLPKADEKSVEGIMKDYIKHSSQQADETKIAVIEEVCNGICEYFDVMLGTQLLYKFERPQYAELLEAHPALKLCQLYGSEHLLRLFVKLGSVLSYANMDEKSMNFIVSHIHQFLDYMTVNGDDLFVPEYETATPEYYRKAAT